MTANQSGAQSYGHSEPHDASAAQQNQIEQTRADLGNTLTELAARTDVKARTREAVSEARDRAKNELRERAQSATMRTRQAVSQARDRTKNELRERAQSATTRTRQAVSKARNRQNELRERAQAATTRTGQAVSQAQDRTKNELQERAQFATMRTHGAASYGASSVRHLRERLGRIPVSGAVAALAALGIYAVLRRRSRSHQKARSRWTTTVGGALAALAAPSTYAVLRPRSRSHRTAPSRWAQTTRARAQGWRR